MRYWWVNHKQTSKYELAGGFLWSPMTKANGHNNRFYDNMRTASPGDAIVSFADAKIQYVGVVTDFATPAPKPTSFNNAGKYWNRHGWLLPISWVALETVIRPKSKILEIESLLPYKYSPIHPKTGNGAQNVYLAEISEALFNFLIVSDDLKNLRSSRPAFGSFTELERIDEVIELAVLTDQNLDSTIKSSIIAARRGQGVFRARVAEFETCCRLTGVTTPALLVASHIKPWRLCASAQERLDGANGLLLAPHVDLLFDRGLITFADDGKISISPRLDEVDIDRLGLTMACNKGSAGFNEQQSEYLIFHRANVFMK